MCVCGGESIHTPWHVGGGQREHSGICSLLPPLVLGDEAWVVRLLWQMLLSAESSHRSSLQLLKTLWGSVEPMLILHV